MTTRKGDASHLKDIQGYIRSNKCDNFILFHMEHFKLISQGMPKLGKNNKVWCYTLYVCLNSFEALKLRYKRCLTCCLAASMSASFSLSLCSNILLSSDRSSVRKCESMGLTGPLSHWRGRKGFLAKTEASLALKRAI